MRECKREREREGGVLLCILVVGARWRNGDVAKWDDLIEEEI